METDDSMKILAEEIFALTGQKVEIFDPVIVAALFQSKLLREAHIDSANYFNAAVTSLIGNVSESMENKQTVIDALVKAQDSANHKMAVYAKNVLRSELPKVREEFHEIAIEVLKEANGLAANNLATRLLAIMPVIVLVAAFAGFYVGKNMSEPKTETATTSSSVEKKTDAK